MESVTIGKNPQRQIIVYDKRPEVIATGKRWWWPIWNDALTAQGQSQLDPKKREESAVWRVEVRAFKRHLKDTWSVSTWGHLREQLPAILHHALCDVRFVTPTRDTNRARWPDHPVWMLAYEAFMQDMEDLHSMVDPADIDELIDEERDQMLLNQISGCIFSRAALNEISSKRLRAYVYECADRIASDISYWPDRTTERLSKARARYGKPDTLDGVPGRPDPAEL